MSVDVTTGAQGTDAAPGGAGLGGIGGRGPGLGVFVSGRGRTLQNLCAWIERGDLNAHVSAVVASRDCPAIAWARGRGLRTELIGVRGGEAGDDPALFDALVGELGAEWVVLAGYTKLLPVPERLRERMVNIHPALLPAFGGAGMYGSRVHRAVLDSGACVSGCTVHLCDERYDSGPIVAQAVCAVRHDDTVETLAARVFGLELELYPRALAALIGGGFRVERGSVGGGGRVVLEEAVGPIGLADTL